MPSKGLRLTAWLAVGLVVGLSIFSASPTLHAWVHAHEEAPATHQPGADGHDQSPSGQDDDGCAITIFGNGVITAVLMVLAAAAIWSLVSLVVRTEETVRWSTPRYWFPPLCGPPLS